MYVIEGLNQTKTEFFRDGMPRRIEFTLSLKRVDESLSDMFGDLSAQLNNLQDMATSALSDISKTVGGLLSGISALNCLTKATKLRHSVSVLWAGISPLCWITV